MDKTTPARFLWDEKKPKKWGEGTGTEEKEEDLAATLKAASYIVWADSIEEAKRMENMSLEELRAYKREKDGAENGQL